MLEKIKAYLGITDTTQDVRLQLLIDMAKTFATDYCGLATYDTALDNTVVAMVVEDFNRIGDEGINSKSISGVSVAYTNGYSNRIMAALKQHRKMKVVG